MPTNGIGKIWVYRIPCIHPTGCLDPYPLVGNRQITRTYIEASDAPLAQLEREYSAHNILLFPTDQAQRAVEYARQEAQRIAGNSAGVPDGVVCLKGSEILYIQEGR